MKTLTGLSFAAVFGLSLLVLSSGFAQNDQENEKSKPQPEQKAAADSDSTHTGEFVKAGDGEFTMTIDGKNQHTHQLLESTKITIDGKRAQLQDLKKGDQIEVTTNDENQAIAVRVMRKDARNAKDNRERTPNATQARRRPVMLGIRIEPSRTTGVHVRDVRDGGPAAKAGLQQGDYILSIDGKKLASPDDFDRVMRNADADGSAELVVWRNGQKSTRTVQFDQRFSASFRPNGEDENNNAPNGSNAWLGVLLAEGDRDQQGVRVERVYPGGPAARSGLMTGDVMTKIGDQSIDDPDQIVEIIEQAKPNQSVKITVMRDDQEMRLTAVLADRSLFAVNDPNDDAGTDRELGEMDDLGEHAMMLEQHRRFAEQHERLENLMYEMLDEIDALRKEVAELKNGRTNNSK